MPIILQMYQRAIYILCIVLLGICGACSSGSNINPQNPSSDTSNSNPSSGPEGGNLPPPSFPEQLTPTLKENFTAASTDFTFQQSIPDAFILYGVSNSSATDNKVVQLTLPGHPEYNQNNFINPPGVQIQSSQNFHYGTFRSHFQTSPCSQNNEGVIYGIFTYWHDGSDTNGNGIEDNSEIDIEISCDSPQTLYLTIWTDYTDNTHFLKVSRFIDLTNGSYTQTQSGEENTWSTHNTGQLTSYPQIATIGEWLDMGFTWASNKVEFFIYQNNQRYPLWTYTNPEHIPQHAAPFLFNVWHSPTLRSNDNPADYPSGSVSLLVDSFSYYAP